MKRMLVAALCAPLSVGLGAASPANAPQEDDWEFAEDAARQLTVAAARFESGPGIVIQCREGALAALLTGMPAGVERLDLRATRADGRQDVQTWRAIGAEGTFRSAVPARDIRFLRGGGAYEVHAVEGAEHPVSATFDLPPQSANLDRVLTACGWDLADERDGLERAAGVSLTDPEASPRRPSRSRSRSITQRSRRMPAPSAEGAPRPPMPPAEQQVSCVVRNLHLADCRPTHAAIAGAPDPAALAARLTGRPVYGPPAGEVEGKVFYSGTPEPLIVVEREEIL